MMAATASPATSTMWRASAAASGEGSAERTRARTAAASSGGAFIPLPHLREARDHRVLQRLHERRNGALVVGRHQRAQDFRAALHPVDVPDDVGQGAVD